jgi:hypothetical protein
MMNPVRNNRTLWWSAFVPVKALALVVPGALHYHGLITPQVF